ncbi:MAG: hypothetical protein ABI596_13355 [Pyrinomonadaceae bacterium]
MKSKRTTIQFCILVLALTAQLSFISPSTGAQNSNSSTTMMQNDNVGIPHNQACRRRCANSYRRCLRSGKNPNACRKQYRNCLRRCPQ